MNKVFGNDIIDGTNIFYELRSSEQIFNFKYLIAGMNISLYHRKLLVDIETVLYNLKLWLEIWISTIKLLL